jgi:hypothetical protein
MDEEQAFSIYAPEAWHRRQKKPFPFKDLYQPGSKTFLKLIRCSSEPFLEDKLLRH